MNNNAIARPSTVSTALAQFNADTVAVLKNTIAANLNDAELAAFLQVSQQLSLNPLAKHVYAMKDKGGRMSLVIGIDGLRALAARARTFLGYDGPYFCGTDGVWRDVWLDTTPPAACKVTGITREGGRITKVVKFNEAKRNSPTWADMPTHMLAIAAQRHLYREAGVLDTAEELTRRAGMALVTAEADEMGVSITDAPVQYAALDEPAAEVPAEATCAGVQADETPEPTEVPEAAAAETSKPTAPSAKDLAARAREKLKDLGYQVGTGDQFKAAVSAVLGFAPANAEDWKELNGVLDVKLMELQAEEQDAMDAELVMERL